MRRIPTYDPFSFSDVSLDFALFRLDSRVSSSVARPHHISLVNDVCPSGWDQAGFEATAVGYGSDFAPVVGADCDPISTRRRYSHHDGWYRIATAESAYYNKLFNVSANYCEEYSGGANGDSGGPLFDDAGNLCGVFSRFGSPPTINNDYASVDDQLSINWLTTVKTTNAAGDSFGILDEDGNFEGECQPYLETCAQGACNDDDFDADGIVDVCDPCPFDAEGSDLDSDGLEDCDDTCPDDPRSPGAPGCDFGGDIDCDGICDGADTCKFTFDPLQRNVNALVEDVWAAWRMGDACEPVPVPKGDPGPLDIVERVDHVDSPFVKIGYQHVVADDVKVKPLRSRRAGYLSTGPISLSPQDVPTHFRYCQYDDQATIDCDDPTLVDSDELHVAAQNDSPSFKYHRVTMSFSSTRGAAHVLDYNDAQHQWTWDYESDAAFWQSSGILTVPPPEGNFIHQAGPASGLNGRFWVHAATQIGTPGEDIGTGEHGPVGPLSGSEELASTYFDLDPEYVTQHLWTASLRLERPLFIWQTLVDPPPDYRLGVISGVLPGDSEIVVPLEGDEFGVIGFDGTAQLLENRLRSARRSSLLDTSLVWASAAEPTGYHGKPTDAMALAITADGSAIAEEVKVIDGDLLGRGDRGFSMAMASLTPGRGRTGFVPVFARTLRAVYLAGGKDSVGVRWPTIARGTLDSDTAWVQLVAPVKLRDVLAATYSYRTRSLYLLDRRHAWCDTEPDEDACEDQEQDRPGATVRFIRVDALRGGGEVIAAWSADDLPERVWLSSDLDGKILFSFASESSREHAILRFDVDALTVEPLVAGSDPLVFPALVDPNGYVIYTRRSTRHPASGRRFDALSGDLHPIADLDTLL